MDGIYEIRHEITDELEIWIEPWCHCHCVPRGSALKLTYPAEGLLTTELTSGRLVVWLNSNVEPEAELDGVPVRPGFGRPGSRLLP